MDKSNIYHSRRYNHKVRWMNFWHQIDEVLNFDIKTLLEVGVGGGVVTSQLKKSGIDVTTLDIDSSTKPDVIGTVTKLPFSDSKFDAILIAEVLEHLPYDDVPKALAELRRVSKNKVIITLPYRGTHFHVSVKIPKISRIFIFIPIPYFWKKHSVSASGHHWEVGKKGYSRKKIRALFVNNHFTIKKEKIFHDDYDRIFYILNV